MLLVLPACRDQCLADVFFFGSAAGCHPLRWYCNRPIPRIRPAAEAPPFTGPAPVLRIVPFVSFCDEFSLLIIRIPCLKRHTTRVSLPANPRLDLLQPYPFERLRALLAATPVGQHPSGLPLVDLSIGEPRHPTPPVVLNALAGATDGLASYPATAGTPALREVIAAWIRRRYDTPVDAATQVLPVNGSREALFSFA